MLKQAKRRNKLLLSKEDLIDIDVYEVTRLGGSLPIKYLGLFVTVDDAKEAARQDANSNRLIDGYNDIVVSNKTIGSTHIELVCSICGNEKDDKYFIELNRG